MKLKKVVLFYKGITGVGGEEKLLFEQARHFNEKGIETHIITYEYNGAYSDAYKMAMHIINPYTCSNLLLETIYKIISLRKKINEIKPDIIISHDYGDCIYLYFATLFNSIPYASLIPETIFLSNVSLQKYALIHRRVFNEIRENTFGGKEFISVKPARSSLIKRIAAELSAIAIYLGIQKAKRIFVLSNRTKWEVYKLYGKKSIVLKGAFSEEFLDYKIKQDIKEKLGITNMRMILNINRLDPRKRIDLLIKTFKQLCTEIDDMTLVIGGTGPEEIKLKNLTKKLNVDDRVKFMGYIPERELKDYLISCDIFVHPGWADFAIAPFEALALQKKVVWSSEMEVDAHLATNNNIFIANPTINDFVKAIKKALNTEVTEKYDISHYSWENYFEKMLTMLKYQKQVR